MSMDLSYYNLYNVYRLCHMAVIKRLNNFKMSSNINTNNS